METYQYQTPIKQVSWPQDKVTVPNGQGTMPHVEFENKRSIKQEAFCYGGSVLVQPNTTGTLIIPIEADGDFWCNSIVMNTTFDPGIDNGSVVTIIDLRTAYNLTYPYSRVNMFANRGSNVTGGVPPTTRLMGSLIQPYCFTRNGGIQVTFANADIAAVAKTYYAAFWGWKEYQYASQ